MSIIFKAPPPWAKSLHVQFVSNQNTCIFQLEFIIWNKKAFLMFHILCEMGTVTAPISGRWRVGRGYEDEKT